MSSEYDDIYRQLEETFVPADDAFWDDQSVVMGSEQEKLRGLFDNLKRRTRRWESSGPCMYRGCKKLSIRRSHAIHRAGSIESIAENQHVLTPRRDNQGQMMMERIGVNVASTFPGFCEEHEQLFSEFEVPGAISAPRHVALQAFRTLCREIENKRQGLREAEEVLQTYRDARERYYREAVSKALPDSRAGELTIEGDAMEERIVSLIESGRADLPELEGDLYTELFEFISGTTIAEPSLQALSLPIEVAVCCSGFGVLTYEYWGDKARALCLFGILPQSGSTLVFFGAARKHAIVVDKYVDDMKIGFGALNAMESWLTNGSDHWFIRPSSWKALSPVRQAKVIDLLTSYEDNIATFLDFSILDEARRNLIRLVRDHLSEADDQEAVLKMLDTEESKMLQ